MTNLKSTKRALFASLMAILLCSAMLLGTTFAWFTDTAHVGVNTIQSGNLDVALEMLNSDGNWVSVEGQTLSFTDEYWQPGCEYSLPKLRVVNNGNLDIKYQVIITGINGDAKLNEVIVWTINGVKIGTDMTLDAGKNAEFTISGRMKADAGNEYQNLKIENIGITIKATQNKDDAVYPEIVYDATDFESALNDEKIQNIIIASDLTYDWGNGSYNNANNLKMQNRTISGATGNEVITFKGYGSANNIKNLTLNNINVIDETKGDNENAWEHRYLEFDNLTANNVNFINAPQLNGTCVLTNCTFAGTSDVYGAWINSGNITLINCTFTGNRGLKIHEAYGSDVTSVTVQGCTFNNSQKPGVVIGTLDSTTSVTIKNSLFNCPAGDQGMHIYESDTAIENFHFTNEGNTVLPDGSKLVYTASELKDALKSNGTIYIANDIDLTGKTWNTVNLVSGRNITIVGNGHTIKGLSNALINLKGNAYATISGLTINGANILGNSQETTFALGTGALVASVDAGSKVILENCHVKNSTIIAENYTDAYGLNEVRAGGLVGYVSVSASQFSVSNCSVENCTITGDNGAAAIVVYTGKATISGCSVSECKISCTENREGSAAKAGYIAGTVVDAVTISGCTVDTNSTLSNNNSAEPINNGYIGRNIGGSVTIK